MAELQSVTIPCTSRDFDALSTILSLWCDERFKPFNCDQSHRPVLIIVYNSVNADQLKRTEQLWEKFPLLANFFEALHVRNADLSGDKDVYFRNEPTLKGQFGNKAGPNFLFFSAMSFAADFGGFTLQIELDCLPLGSNWLGQVAKIASDSNAWVVASPYVGANPLERTVQFHLNGNGLYRCGDTAFQEFLMAVFMKSLLELRHAAPNLAYDCWWSYQMSRANALSRNDAWKTWQRYCFFWQNSAMIVNLTVSDLESIEYLEKESEMRELGLNPIFFHGAPMTKVAKLLVDNKTQSVSDAITYLISPSNKSDRFISAENAEDGDFESLKKIMRPAVGISANKLLLGSGFHYIEGPSERFFPVRYVWSSSHYLPLFPVVLVSDIVLLIKAGNGASIDPKNMPDITIEQLGVAIPFTVAALENKGFIRIVVPKAYVREFEKLELNIYVGRFQETTGAKRSLCALLFESDCTLIKI